MSDEWEDLIANRKALEEIAAQRLYAAKKAEKRESKRKRLGRPIDPKKSFFRPTSEAMKNEAYYAKRVLPPPRFYPREPPVCDMLRTGEGRRIVDRHLIISATEHRPETSLVCDDAGTLVEGSNQACPGYSRPYVLLESAPRMRDHGLDFKIVGHAGQQEIPNYCSIDSDNRHMACANIRDRFNERLGEGEHDRMSSLRHQKFLKPSEEFEYRKRRLMDEYGIGVCEVRL